jgi:hypothetical protein
MAAFVRRHQPCHSRAWADVQQEPTDRAPPRERFRLFARGQLMPPRDPNDDDDGNVHLHLATNVFEVRSNGVCFPDSPGFVQKMTAKTWCAISKAVEILKTARNTTAGPAQAWLIAECAAGNIRSRVPSSGGSEVLLNDNRQAGMDVRARGRLGIGSRRRAPEPVSPAAWKDAVIDGDVLVANHGRWFGIEISIADLEFDLRQSLPTEGHWGSTRARSQGTGSDQPRPSSSRAWRRVSAVRAARRASPRRRPRTRGDLGGASSPAALRSGCECLLTRTESL